MSGSRSRLGIAAVLAGVLFATGLFSVFLLPGGGKVTDQQFTDFYNSTGRRGAALALFFALVVGSWLMAWFFGELRRAYAPGALADYAERAAWLGAVSTVIGAGVALGPVGVQVNSGQSFVGIPIAHALDQAGLLILIVGGVYSFALATFLMCLHASRTSSAPRWQTISGRIIAVLLLASYVGTPAMLLPLWAIVVGIASLRSRKVAVIEAELASV